MLLRPRGEDELYGDCARPQVCDNSGDANVLLGFALTLGAGLATTLGALLTFMPWIKMGNTKWLAYGLAASAGVMLYVSFVEIFQSSEHYFCCIAPKHQVLLATVCFFGGIAATIVLDLFLHWVGAQDSRDKIQQLYRKLCCGRNLNVMGGGVGHLEDIPTAAASPPPSGSGSPVMTPDAKESLEDLAQMEMGLGLRATKPREKAQVVLETSSSSTDEDEEANEIIDDEDLTDEDGVSSAQHGRRRRRSKNEESSRRRTYGSLSTHEPDRHGDNPPLAPPTKDRLRHMGLLTGIAIAIHNFPEGIATFVATLADARVGVGLAIAITFHNIPEGIAVALPVYYATGSKWWAFFWAFLSGISEPVGALLAWLILRPLLGPTTFAILFGFIAGMMTQISLHELLPMAYRIVNTNGMVSFWLVLGMAVMAVSLVIFEY